MVQIDQGTQHHPPINILLEYNTWLNSILRLLFSGINMTDACFDRLPLYTRWKTGNERINYRNFGVAVSLGYAPISPDTLNNEQVVQWVYT